MRSKLAISPLAVASLFGSMLIASAQSQPVPGGSSEGSVDRATSGKDTKHEKGMTSRHSGADKGGARNPSDDNKGDAGDSSAQVGVGPKNTGKMH
jgi:hypothetical protein